MIESFYEKLVRTKGEEVAKAHMRAMRAKVKKPTGFATMSKKKRREVQAMAVEARRKKSAGN